MKALLWVWQLPQHLMGLLFVLLFGRKAQKERYESAIVYWISQEWGISLGWYIFLNPNLHNKTTVKHEYGHSIQSQRLGPLYLFVVGLPSITMNTLSMILYRAGKPAFARNYYNRWPESWADTLGGVKR